MELLLTHLRKLYTMIQGGSKQDRKYAITELLRHAIFTQEDYKELTSAMDIVRMEETDMAYIKGHLSKEQMKQWEDFKWALFEKREKPKLEEYKKKHPEIYAKEEEEHEG